MAIDLTIRPATDSDFEPIWAMLEPVFRAGETYAVDPGISREAALDYWCSGRAYIAEKAGPLGTFYMRGNRQGGGAHVCNCGYVTGVEAQGQGVARAMLAFSLTEARALGFEAMQFNFVLASNRRAVEIWTRAGFSEIGRQPRAFRFGDGTYADALVMHRFL